MSGKVKPRPRATNVLDQLEASNFKVCDKIVAKDKNGKSVMAYIKCVTPLGHPVYVDMDNPNVSDSATMAEVESVNTMPEEIKKKHFKSAGNGVTGVVLECEHNICTLNRDDEKEDPNERNFVYLDNTNKKSLMGDNPTPIPIVKLTDIRANGPQVITSINEATIRMRKGLYEEGLRKFEITRKALQDVYEELTRFAENIDAKMASTIQIIAGLEDRQKYILENGLREDETDIMKVVNDNAIRFNDLIAEENRCIISINNLAPDLEKIANKIKMTNTYLDEKYEENIVALEKSKTELRP